MAEALDKVKKELGLDNPKGTSQGKEDKAPSLEEVIEEMADGDKKDLLRAKAREMRAEMELRTRQLEQRTLAMDRNAKAGGAENDGPGASENSDKAGRAKRWSVIDGMPMRDDEDGEYDTFLQAYKAATLQAQKNSPNNDTASIVKGVVKALKDEGIIGSANSEEGKFIRALADKFLESLKPEHSRSSSSSPEIQALSTKIRDLETAVTLATDPVESAKRVKALRDALVDAGVISPGGGGSQGETIDQLKEKHRHQEKIRELDIEGKYKENLTETLSEIPERIGRGLASQISEEEDEGSSEKSDGGESGFKSFHCQCGHDISIPPEAGPTITCGECGAIYSREKPAPESEAKK